MDMYDVHMAKLERLKKRAEDDLRRAEDDLSCILVEIGNVRAANSEAREKRKNDEADLEVSMKRLRSVLDGTYKTHEPDAAAPEPDAEATEAAYARIARNLTERQLAAAAAAAAPAAAAAAAAPAAPAAAAAPAAGIEMYDIGDPKFKGTQGGASPRLPIQCGGITGFETLLYVKPVFTVGDGCCGFYAMGEWDVHFLRRLTANTMLTNRCMMHLLKQDETCLLDAANGIHQSYYHVKFTDYVGSMKKKVSQGGLMADGYSYRAMAIGLGRNIMIYSATNVEWFSKHSDIYQNAAAYIVNEPHHMPEEAFDKETIIIKYSTLHYEKTESTGGSARVKKSAWLTKFNIDSLNNFRQICDV